MEIFTQTLSALRDFSKAVSASNKTEPTDKLFLGYKAHEDKVKNLAAKWNKLSDVVEKINLSNYNAYKKYKKIQAMQVTPNILPRYEQRLCVDLLTPTRIQDVLDTSPLPTPANRFVVDRLTDSTSTTPAAIPPRTYDRNPVAEAAVKRVYNSVVGQTNVDVVKLAYQENVTLEAERNYDGINFVLSRALERLMDIVHLYVIQQLSAGAPALGAAFYPTAGTYPQPTVMNAIHWISRRYQNKSSECRDRLHVFLPTRRFVQWQTTFDVADGYWNKDNLEGNRQWLDFVRVHNIEYDFSSPAVALGADSALIVPSDGYFLGMDSDVLVYKDRLPQTNQTIITVEIFIAASRLPHISGFYLTGTQDITATTVVATALANI